MGVGKSSTGRLLARLSARRFVDLDERIRHEVGQPISSIFRERGEDYFRDCESRTLRALSPGGDLVVATGGGVVLRPENREYLRTLGFVVWLHATPEVIHRRVAHNRTRPLLQTPDPRATIVELLARRQALYRCVANTAVDTSTLSRDQVARRILASLKQWERPG